MVLPAAFFVHPPIVHTEGLADNVFNLSGGCGSLQHAAGLKNKRYIQQIYYRRINDGICLVTPLDALKRKAAAGTITKIWYQAKNILSCFQKY
jgi:hypothetical protein